MCKSGLKKFEVPPKSDIAVIYGLYKNNSVSKLQGSAGHELWLANPCAPELTQALGVGVAGATRAGMEPLEAVICGRPVFCSHATCRHSFVLQFFQTGVPWRIYGSLTSITALWGMILRNFNLK